ncbi:MAG: hypothetical protein ACXWV4_03250 [Flavitalea sp.]
MKRFGMASLVKPNLTATGLVIFSFQTRTVFQLLFHFRMNIMNIILINLDDLKVIKPGETSSEEWPL